MGQLISGGDPTFRTADASPWLDMRVIPKEPMMAALEAQTQRRFIKSHLPTDCLPYNPNTKYIYLVRDGRGEARVGLGAGGLCVWGGGALSFQS